MRASWLRERSASHLDERPLEFRRQRDRRCEDHHERAGRLAELELLPEGLLDLGAVEEPMEVDQREQCRAIRHGEFAERLGRFERFEVEATERGPDCSISGLLRNRWKWTNASSVVPSGMASSRSASAGSSVSR